MKYAYIDTSWLIKISFEDKSGQELSFLTAGEHQQEVARALGFKTRK